MSKHTFNRIRYERRALRALLLNFCALPILRVYTFIDDIQNHLCHIEQDHADVGASEEFLQDIHEKNVVPAEKEIVDFLTNIDFRLKEICDSKLIGEHIMKRDYKKEFPIAFKTQRVLSRLAKRLGIKWIYAQVYRGDFNTLCFLASEYGDVASETLDDMWNNKRWKGYFQKNPDYIVTLPIFRAIESLRERLTMEEWGNRRKMFFGESQDEMYRLRNKDDEEDNDRIWER